MTLLEIVLSGIILVLVGVLIAFRVAARRQKRQPGHQVRDRRRSKRPTNVYQATDRETPILKARELGKSHSTSDAANPADSTRRREERP